ncbi:2-phospho-L-lactate guanylyltransferase [Archaeoglobus neptunius]|uniref:2-phospho-L-lactate guanylyltransferase n=1 Tax=Archaeoglobus neptunius TaxID=2798580 RepID=UPI0019261968|nr:2-phospho-L-lactate guanylyltransferase [Archaeoglobus neptunius]
MRILIPFKATNPKSRLSGILDFEERKKLAELMLLDVVEAVSRFGSVKVVSPAKINIEGVDVVVDSSDLNTVVNSEINNVPLAVVMSDLPLLSGDILQRFFNSEGDVVIAPGRKGGTNMLLVRREGFRVSYHYGSFFKHVEYARKIGFSVSIFDSFYSSVDIDDESDLLELIMHGKGKRSWKFLTQLGFRVSFEKTPRLERVS